MHASKRILRFIAAVSVSVAAGATSVVAVSGVAAATGLPTVSGVSPNRGPDAGGTSVTVTGTGLTGATAVYFGTAAGTSIVVGSDTSLTVTAPAHTSSTVDITVVAPGGTSLTSAADIYTFERVLFTDSFTNATTAEPMYLPAGTGASNVACLTAGSSTSQTPVPDCATTGGDTAGQGVLRLTSNAGNLEGAAFYSTSLPTANGLDLTFDTYQYGSSSEADGIAFGLGATDPSNPSAPVNMGPAGGHLGYSAGTAAPSGVGLAHGYMGFGLDVYGNFTNSAYEGTGCTDPSWSTTGVHPQNVTIRGPGNGMVGYCMVDSTLNPSHGGGLGGMKLDNVTGTDTTRSTSLVPVEVALNPSTAPAITESGITIPAASWAIEVTPIGGTAKLMTGALPTIANGLYPSSWINQATGMPYTLTFGWVASTGGSTDVHAVSNVSATTLQPLSSTVFNLTNTDSGSSALTGGSSYTSSFTATLNAASGVEMQPITVAGTYPAGLVPTTISGGAGWTNCLVTGQTFSCTYPASAGSPVTAGTSLPPIHVGFDVRAGASQVANATVVQGQVTSADSLPASGNDYTTVTYGTATASSMAPTQGSTSGGTAVVITGTNLYGVTAVTFDGTAATSVSHDSNTQITAYSPAHVAATKSVVLTYGTSSTVTAGSFTWNAAAPTITSISPGSGPTSGGTVVTITGTNFTGATTVLFGATSATSITVVSSTTITATSPPGVAGPAVDVTTSNGTGSTAFGGGFVYYTTPVPTGMTPVQGPTTGFTTVNISGSGFTSVTGVDFGGTAASSYTINSDSSITASTPVHTAGATTVHLSYGGGTVSAPTFTFIGPPTFTLMSPTSGPTAGGTTVTVTGTNLQGSAVTVGGLPATNILVAPDGTSLTFVTPAESAGPAAVVIGAVAGSVSAGNYTYLAPPTISGLAPTSGPESGGTSVVITGAGFSGATAVKFGGIAAAAYTVDSSTQITATTAPGIGVVTVSVTTSNGTGTSVGTFTFLSAPTVTGLVPNLGPQAGGTSVVITGTGFSGATNVSFGGTSAATYTVDSSTQITATTPAGTGAVTVSVTTANGTGTSVGTFSYIPAPSITSFTPTSGPESGGTSVVIAGTALTGATNVSFGGVPAATYTVNSPTQITATTAIGVASLAVSVTTAYGTGVSVGTFTFLPPPVISGLTPTTGPEAGGTSVVITGTGFTGATNVSFGGTSAATYTVNSPTQITATTPAGTGDVTVSVTTANGTGTSSGTFGYVPAPSISGFTPTTGPEAGGTTVVITGTALTGATNVSFGGVPAATYTVNSPTQITATSPAGVGAVTLRVTTANGTAISFGTFSYAPTPSISGLAPTTGPESGGTVVVITGTGFTGASAVSFGGTAAASYTVDSPTQISALSPAGTGTVTVDVTTVGGSAVSSGTFTYVAAGGGGGGGGLGGGLGGSGGGGGGSGDPASLSVSRIGGADRDATANLISQAMYPTAHTAHVVILARDDVFADALAGSPMSKVFGGPVLLTPSHSLGASAQAGIVRVLNPGDTVYILGGPAAISDGVLAQINALGFATVRIGGTDRYDTAALIAAKLSTSEVISKVYLATGINFPDALAAASAAGSTNGVILLTADGVMPSATSGWLTAHAALPLLAVGGQAATAAPGAVAMAGADRYATATAVATATYPAPTGLLLATGVNFPDALAGAAYAAQQGWGLLLVDPGATSISTAQSTYLTAAAPSVSSVVILGGTSALPDAAANLIVTALKG
jgi:large repetitive protein